jgi:hypothetical protein
MVNQIGSYYEQANRPLLSFFPRLPPKAAGVGRKGDFSCVRVVAANLIHRPDKRGGVRILHQSGAAQFITAFLVEVTSDVAFAMPGVVKLQHELDDSFATRNGNKTFAAGSCDWQGRGGFYFRGIAREARE